MIFSLLWLPFYKTSICQHLVVEKPCLLMFVDVTNLSYLPDTFIQSQTHSVLHCKISQSHFSIFVYVFSVVILHLLVYTPPYIFSNDQPISIFATLWHLTITPCNYHYVSHYRTKMATHSRSCLFGQEQGIDYSYTYMNVNRMRCYKIILLKNLSGEKTNDFLF